MKKYFVLTLFILAVLVTGGAGCAKSDKAVETNSKTNTETGETKSKRTVVTCDYFYKQQVPSSASKEIQELLAQTNTGVTPGSMGSVPSWLAPTGNVGKLCGGNLGLESAYFTSSLSEDELFAQYIKILTANGCSTDGVTEETNKMLPYVKYLPYSCPGTKSSGNIIYAYSNVSAFAIVYRIDTDYGSEE